MVQSYSVSLSTVLTSFRKGRKQLAELDMNADSGAWIIKLFTALIYGFL